MAIISDSTFNPLARYVNVRMQQGVPIVDADINELDDIRQFELRAFLKWFVGDGIPDGNDGFRVEGIDQDNDFAIRVGQQAQGDGSQAERALRKVGRIIVDGLDVIIEDDVEFKEQLLHEDQKGADVLAAALGVPKIVKLDTPSGNGTVAVYIDVWQSMVTADDETKLLHDGLGIETCARVRREWVVRVRPGTSPPKSGDRDFLDGHSYALLALIDRRNGDKRVRPADVTDRRQQRLQLPPATLVEDVWGMSIDDYRASLQRPPISMRNAVNSLLRGELPMTLDDAVAEVSSSSDSDTMSRAFLLDGGGGLVAAFTRALSGDVDQVYITRMSLDVMSSGFPTPVRLTSGAAHSRPSVAELPDGSLFVAYQSESSDQADVLARWAPFSGLADATVIEVATTKDVPEQDPFVVVAGQVVTVFFHKKVESDEQPTTDRWYYRRWANGIPLDDVAKQLANIDTGSSKFHAAVDNDGNIWAVFTQAGGNGGFWVVKLNPAEDEGPSMPTKIGDAITGDTQPPFVLCPEKGGAWVIWHNGGILTNFIDGEPDADSTEEIADTDENDGQPCAVEAADGSLWMIWRRKTDTGDLLARRRDSLGQWGVPRQIVTSATEDSNPFALAGRDTTIWLFWDTDRDHQVRVYYKRLVTAI